MLAKLLILAFLLTVTNNAYAQTVQMWAVADANGNIVNLVQWDGVKPYDPGPGLTLKEVATQADTNAYRVYIDSLHPVVPSPNPTQFFADVANDSVCRSVLSALAPYQYTIENYATNPQAVMLIWSQLCANNSSVITPTIQTAVETHAAANNMPLAQ